MPEGFEKVAEEVTFSKVSYKYENDAGEYVVLNIFRDKAASEIDNEENIHNIALSDTGLEYRSLYKEAIGEYIVVWNDAKGFHYYVAGSLEKEEIIKIMDGILY